MTEGKQRAATVGDPTSPSCISHPLQFIEVDLGPIEETISHPLANEGTLIEIETPLQAAAADGIPADAPTAIWDLPPPDFNGPSPDAAPPAYDEALTCGTECPPLPRHPYHDDFDHNYSSQDEHRRQAEMRLELALIKANRKKMYINFVLGLIFFLVILIICRFTIFNYDGWEQPVVAAPTTTTVEIESTTESVPQP